ncbi:MAG: PAS domain S-box protein [Chloroflexi bacterium]|nr:PAS domain S-box protein [Chloroflexota bacterium]
MPPSKSKPGRLLIVDDEVELVMALCEILTRQGYEAVGLASGREALQALKEQEFDLLLADLMIPDLDGIALLRAGLETDPHLVGIIMTGQGTVPTAVEAMKIGAFDYLLKPFKFNAVLPVLARAMDVRRLRLENVQLRETATVYELIQTIAFTLDSGAILNKVAEVALRQCEADEVSIMLPTEAGDELYVAVARGERAEHIVGKRAPLEQGVAGWVARYRELLALPGEVRDSRFAPLYPRPDIGFAVSMPMIAGNRFVGVLNANTTRRRPFTSGQVKALTILTGAASAALEAARLYEQARRVEEKERLILENVDEVVYMIGISDDPFRGTTQFVSPRVKNIIGYRAEEFLNDPGLWARLIHPDDISTIGSQTQAIYASGQSGTREYRVRHKTTGEYHWMEDRVTPLYDAAGKVMSVFGVARDITERKRMEAERTGLLNMLESSLNEIYLFNAETLRFQYVNAGALRNLGYSRAAIETMTPLDLKPEFDDASFRNLLAPLLNHERELLIFQTVHRRADASLYPVEAHLQLVEQNGAQMFLAIILDITERKQAEVILKKLSSAVEQTADNVFICNRDGVIEYVNPAFEQLTGYTQAEAIGQTPRLLKSGQHASRFFEKLWDTILAGCVFRATFINRKKSGELYYEEKTITPLRDDHSNITHFVSTGKDVTERMRAEAALEKSEAELRALFAAMPDVVVVYDRQGRYLKIAPTNTSLLYKPPGEMIGKTLPEVLPAPQANLLLEHIQRALDTQQTVMLDYSLSLWGQETWFAGAVSPMPGEAAILVARDITERKWRERELEVIVGVSAALRAAPTRSAMLPIILGQLLELFKVDGAALAMLDPSTGEMVIELGQGSWVAWKGERLPMGEGVSGRAIATRQPYVNNDMRSDPLFARPDLLAGSNAVACAPLMVEEWAIGTLWIGRGRAPGPALYSEITSEELRLLTAIADMAANAIHRATLHEQTLRYAADLALAYDTTIEGWSRALDLRDKETEGHTLRVTEMVLRLARAMGIFSEEQLLHIRRGALLHDIGKMGIPDPILLKPGSLTDEEWVIMRKHPGYAHDLLSPIVYLHPALDIPYCHHEKWDGTGYPRGLKGEAIPLAARLFAVVDVWDALRSDRPYRPAWPEEKAREHIQSLAGMHFDPKVIEAFLSMSNDM